MVVVPVIGQGILSYFDYLCHEPDIAEVSTSLVMMLCLNLSPSWQLADALRVTYFPLLPEPLCWELKINLTFAFFIKKTLEDFKFCKILGKQILIVCPEKWCYKLNNIYVFQWSILNVLIYCGAKSSKHKKVSYRGDALFLIMKRICPKTHRCTYVYVIKSKQNI